MNNGTVRPATLGQFRDLISALIQAIPLDLSFDQAQYWAGHKGEFAEKLKFLRKPSTPQSDDFIALIFDWQNFYEEVFNIEVNLSGIRISEKRKGFDRLLILVPGMTPQRLLNECRELFRVRAFTNDDLDKAIVSDRTAQNGAYAVWVRDRIESDREFKHKSASSLKWLPFCGITLEERLVYELKYFKETGKHLDINNWTLCSGSRYNDSIVPGVYYDSPNDILYVDNCHTDSASDGRRAREVSY